MPVAAALVACLVVGAAFAAVQVARGPSRLDQAIAITDDDDRFAAATDAALAFGRVSSILKQEGEACARKDSNRPRCADLFAASAIAQISGVILVRCRIPDVFDARQAMRSYLRDLDAGRSPEAPPTPSC